MEAMNHKWVIAVLKPINVPLGKATAKPINNAKENLYVARINVTKGTFIVGLVVALMREQKRQNATVLQTQMSET